MRNHQLLSKYNNYDDMTVREYNNLPESEKPSRKSMSQYEKALKNINKPLNESILFSKSDFEYRYDDFINKKCKFMFILGFSGSGKTTIARNLSKELNCTLIELDDMITPKKFSDDNLKEYDELVYKFFTEHPLGIKYRHEEFIDFIKDRYMAEFIKFISSNANKQYIFEGVELIYSLDNGQIPISVIKNNSCIIKGTSAVKSSYRAYKRNKVNVGRKEANAIFKNNIRYYPDENKIIDKIISKLK